MIDHTLYCVICGATRVRKQGAFYTANIPTCCEKAMIDKDATTLATIEQGTTDYTVRVLEPGKQPEWFVYNNTNMNVPMLQQAIRNTYTNGVVFLDTDVFNANVERLT